MNEFAIPLKNLSLKDIELVGGKNASLGELIKLLKNKSINVPPGFAITTKAYSFFLEHNQLRQPISEALNSLDNNLSNLEITGIKIRNLFQKTSFPKQLINDIKDAYNTLEAELDHLNVDVAVRSSATAEDLPEASFAGQLDTYLNVTGIDNVLDSIRQCFSSLFTDRAIYYRKTNNYNQLEVSISVCIQKMVRSDLSSSGVIFTIDTETGFPDIINITGSWGLGECVVQGIVTPDEFIVYKSILDKDCEPIISKKLGDKHKKMIYSEDYLEKTKIIDTTPQEQNKMVLHDFEIMQLSRWATEIEAHYQKPMDIEWAKDGITKQLYIVQARPETVQSRNRNPLMQSYELLEKSSPIVEGLSIGEAIVGGKVCIIKNVEDISQFIPGSILVTEMTDPDWVPIMGLAAGIITDHGGRTCHAAIVSRELGVPTIVGTGNATKILKSNQKVTLSTAQGYIGFVYNGLQKYKTKEIDLTNIPNTKIDMMLNLANPDTAFRWWRLPSKGIGLARMEFIINNTIKIHPMALVGFDTLKDTKLISTINEYTKGYTDKKSYFIDQLAYGVAKIAASQYPQPVIVRMSDFKTNEYANLIGGKYFEDVEENPMLGFRGASRYYSSKYRCGFEMECKAIKKVREKIGLDNVKIMIPFCRTLDEADKVHQVLEAQGLKRGENNLEIFMMCEVPSNVILAKQFAEKFDGFSIGSNDLTQLTLGVDRDSAKLSPIFDERNEAVKSSIKMVIKAAKEKGIKVGICGQGPSDHTDFALFLVEAGIDSMSLNPDCFVKVKKRVAEYEYESKVKILKREFDNGLSMKVKSHLPELKSF